MTPNLEIQFQFLLNRYLGSVEKTSKMDFAEYVAKYSP